MLEIIAIRILMLIGALALIYWGYKKITSSLSADKENIRLLKQVVELAQNTNGRITAADISFALEIPVKEADRILEKLVEEGLATVEVDLNEGSLVYDVPRARKNQAQERVQRQLGRRSYE